MNSKLLVAVISALSLGLMSANSAFARHDDHHDGHHGHDHGHPGHHDHHNDDWDDADTAVASALGASLLTASLDAASKSSKTAMIQQAETEALAYSENAPTSEVFQNAKMFFEEQAGQSLTDGDAAILIVEFNQSLRAQL